MDPSGLIDATQTPLQCLQHNRNDTTEDCLTLNIYTPANITENSNLPTYVFIHGGSLQSGTSLFAPSHYLVKLGPLVLVSIQYRLGPFGQFNMTLEALQASSAPERHLFLGTWAFLTTSPLSPGFKS